jgi:hypothetical protein
LRDTKRIIEELSIHGHHTLKKRRYAKLLDYSEKATISMHQKIQIEKIQIVLYYMYCLGDRYNGSKWRITITLNSVVSVIWRTTFWLKHMDLSSSSLSNHQNKQSISIFVVSSYRYILISNKNKTKKHTVSFFQRLWWTGCRFAVKLSAERQLNQIKQKR